MKAKTKEILRSLAILLLGIFVFIQNGPAVSRAETFPGPDAKAIWDYIQNNNYTKWQNIPGYPNIFGKTAVDSPHAPFLKVFINNSAAWSIQKDLPEMSNFSLIVLENYKEDQKTMDFIAIRYKYYGYNPDGGDWFWATYTPAGEVLEVGKIESCIKCHTSAKWRDYISTKPKKLPHINLPVGGP